MRFMWRKNMINLEKKVKNNPPFGATGRYGDKRKRNEQPAEPEKP
jgi:hypothetical protein